MELNINKEEICDEPDPGKFENWTQSLDILIASNSGKLAFAAFLQDEYSIENWHFLMEAGKFSKIKNILELKGKQYTYRATNDNENTFKIFVFSIFF